MTASGPLQRFVDDALTHAPHWLHDVSQDALRTLLDSHHPAQVSLPREAIGPAVDALQRSSRRLIDGFVVALNRRIEQELDAAPDPGERADQPIAQGSIGSWQLVDADAAEQDIEVLRTIQLVDSQAEAELRELLARTTTLRGDTVVRVDANPIRPDVIARALWASIDTLGLPPKSRLALMRAISAPLAHRLKTVYAAALRQLEAWGVQPASYRAVPAPSAGREADPPRSGFDLTRPGAFDTLKATTRPMPAPASPAGMARPPSTANTASATNTASTASTVDSEGQALLAQLFDKIRTDPRLLPEVRAVLARLQPGLQQLAQADARLLDDYRHPAWQLLNGIAGHTLGYARADDRRLRAFLAGLDIALAELLRQPAADPLLYRRALQQVQALIDEQLRAERDAVAEVIDKLHLAAARNQIAPLLHQEVVAQLVGVELDDALRRFLYGPWVQTAATRAALDGIEAAQPFLDAVELLAASLQPPSSVSERAQLLQRIPRVVRLLRDGMLQARLPDGERDALLGALMAQHHDLLSRPLRPPEASPELSPEEIVQRLRDEPEYQPPIGPGASHTVLDVAMLETVPASLFDRAQAQTPVEPTRADAAWLVRAEPGLWVQLFSGGGWLRARLLWRSADGEQWVFGGATPGTAHALTLRALRRLSDEHLAFALEDRNLIERAVDALLAERAARPGR